jgi:hypothetical protein
MALDYGARQLIPVGSGENVGGMGAAVEPTGVFTALCGSNDRNHRANL